MPILKYFITLFLVLVSFLSFSSSTYAAQTRTIPTLPPLIQIPTHPPIPTIPKIEIKKGNAAVEIVSPEDKAPVKKEENLPVKVHFNTSHIKAKVSSIQEKTYYLQPIQAVELLLDGKSYEVKQLKKPLKEGDVTFDLSFASLPEDATDAQLQAKIYTVYIQPKPPKIKGIKKLAAESEIVTVLFKQIIGPEGGIASFNDGVNVIVPEGAFSQDTEVDAFVEPLSFYMSTLNDDFSLIGSVQLDIGTNEANSIIDISTLPITGELPPADAQILVSEIVTFGQESRRQLIDLAAVQDGKLITHQLLLFPGIMKSGLYTFDKAKAPVGFVYGKVTRESGESVEGAIVTISRLPLFVGKTDKNGKYLIPAPVGKTFAVTAFDPKTATVKSVGGAVPEKGGEVAIDIILPNESVVYNKTLENGGFEQGLQGWTKKGSATTIANLGPIKPKEGNMMAIVSTGEGAIGNASSGLEQAFIVPEGAKVLKFDYNFVSEEFPEFKNSIYNDTFQATLTSANGSKEIAFESINGTNDTKPVSGIDFPGGDTTVEMTDWKTATIILDGKQNILTLTISDLGDTIYDSVILVDNVRIEVVTNKFLDFPVAGGSSTTTTMRSILDHSGVFYSVDKIVEAFDGQKANFDFGGNKIDSCKKVFEGKLSYSAIQYDCAYKNQAGSSFEFKKGDVKVATYAGGSLLHYDGHDGYDYDAGTLKAIAKGTLENTNDFLHRVRLNITDPEVPQGYMAEYLHMNVKSDIKDQDPNQDGIQVNRGDEIGTAGGWGPTTIKCPEPPDNKNYNNCKPKSDITISIPNAFGVHLHFAVYHNYEIRDPYGYRDQPILWK